MTTAYQNSTSLFQTPANGGSMPWWGSSASATAFATALLAADPSQSVFGYPNTNTSPPRSPFFAWDYTFDPGGPDVSYTSVQQTNPPTLTNPIFKAAETVSRDYFIATAVEQVPGPLPLFGAAAAFGWSRRLRRRTGG